MMMSEFTKRTGIFPDTNLYMAIEQAYMDSDMDKDTFCEKYLRNVDGLADRVQADAFRAEWNQREEHEKTVAALNAELKKVQDALDREQEWRRRDPDAHNYTTDEYERLKADSCTEKWSDAQALDYLYCEFGFAPERVKILHDVPLYDVNRHGLLRERERVERLPLYSSTDWNYIRFNVGGYAYECQDGELCRYYQ